MNRERLHRKACARRRTLGIGISTALITLVGCSATKSIGGAAPPSVARMRDRSWATPVKRPGLSNAFKVSDVLYRGAQPEAEGIRALKGMGVKTVVNLRSYHSDRDEIGDIQIGYEEVSMSAWDPKVEHAVRFLQIVAHPAKTPVFVHCQHGSDRTGTMVAVYRIVVQGWSKDRAIREMTDGGYGYHKLWRDLITFLRELDVDYVKTSAGLAPAATR